MGIIPVFRPSMGEEEADAVKEVIDSGYIICGPKVREFEKKFAGFIGVKYAVATNSGTAALHLALRVLDIDKCEVISSPLTFVSTIHSILYNHAIPVFSDIQPDTLNLDPADTSKKLSEKTKVVVAVHYGGHPCEMDELDRLADEKGLIVVEDAAHACGAEYKEKKAGNLGTIACFSFHGVKNLSTGDGGMITTNDKAIAERLLRLRWLGINKDTFSREKKKNYSWDYGVEELGFKYHMNDIAAAIGLVQLKKLKRMNKEREQLWKAYNDSFSKIPWVETPLERSYVKSSYHNYVIKVPNRNKLIEHLNKSDISASVHYRPIYHHKIYKQLGIREKCPVAERVWKKLVTLPLFPDLGSAKQERIITAVKSFKPFK